ncbi:hypothetical protein VHEMI09226 [[Torrubiella] hemipterigena]|uniref:Peptidase S8/S53 domain-containing protein n=1 Tax=[Torrubiella] hemipterigena TaxID=1531966 RepID=A0A0A1TPP2_9HYPO|nr:hypothetical protein VHEMI09226 [[Torrubiella] hemipterigena]
MRMSTLAAAVLPAAVLANRVAPLNMRNTAIKGEYIVQLFDEASLTSDDGAMKILKEEPRYTWKSAINGFSATMDEQTLEAMRQHPDVKQITENGMVHAAGWAIPGTEGPIVHQSPNPANDWLKQDKPVWGLARSSNKAPKGTVYEYHKSQGEGICAWVLDTGIDAKHPEFEGRAENVLNMIKKEENTDLNNHGTHCAGTIGSKTYGIAKKVLLKSIKVLGANASGPDDGIVEAINWMLENLPKRDDCKGGHVVNMSFTADNIHPAMKEGCAKLVKAGWPVAVASGNSNRDASKDSPGDEPLVCTAAATDAVSFLVSGRTTYYALF